MMLCLVNPFSNRYNCIIVMLYTKMIYLSLLRDLVLMPVNSLTLTMPVNNENQPSLNRNITSTPFYPFNRP